MRRISKTVYVGTLPVGGGNPVSIQSMLNVSAEDVEGNAAQAAALEQAGCEIIRAAVPTLQDVRLIPALKRAVKVPIVADIHFDYKIALAAAEAGVDKIRINPGNIGSKDRVRAVAEICLEKNIPIRIGVNAGSLEKEILHKFGGITAEALVESGLYHASLLEEFGFYNIILSLKASNVPMMYDAYRIAAERTDYPLHLGVTEAGTKHMGIVKSAAGIGGLLLAGIGDTIRVSLTDDPVEEVRAAKDILKATGYRKEGVTVVSCPTCGRTKIDLIALANRVEDALHDCKKEVTVAVMGCVVNGPGEAKDADIGVAGGDGCGMIFKKGEIVQKVEESELFEALMKEIEAL